MTAHVLTLLLPCLPPPPHRWHALRTKTVARSVSASFRGWCAWVRASRYRRHSLVAAAWRGWRELMQLELLYCSKVGAGVCVLQLFVIESM